LGGPDGAILSTREVDEFVMSDTAAKILIAKPDEGGGSVGRARLRMDPLILYPDDLDREPFAVFSLNTPGAYFEDGLVTMKVPVRSFILQPDGSGVFETDIHLTHLEQLFFGTHSF
jgi:hypothetical protein